MMHQNLNVHFMQQHLGMTEKQPSSTDLLAKEYKAYNVESDIV